jgi:hypothetical protein
MYHSKVYLRRGLHHMGYPCSHWTGIYQVLVSIHSSKAGSDEKPAVAERSPDTRRFQHSPFSSSGHHSSSLTSSRISLGAHLGQAKRRPRRRRAKDNKKSKNAKKRATARFQDGDTAEAWTAFVRGSAVHASALRRGGHEHCGSGMCLQENGD